MAIDILTEEVATNLEEVAAVTRGITGKSVGLLVGGIVVGAMVGFYFGYRFNREKIKAEIFAESELEVEKIRSFYTKREVTRQEQIKPSIEELIEKKGYSTPILQEYESGKRPLPAPVPVNEPPASPSISFEEVQEWDYEAELEARTPLLPYVLHQDEFNTSETGYRQIMYTYYAGDDVLVGEDERPLPHADIIVGINNLKFGHGSDDDDVVYVRNEHMELEFEITRTASSYEKEIMGHDVDKSN